MGCITSKVMSKSLSFKEELNQSLQRRSNSISSIEQLIISGNKSNQFLDLLCSANMVDKELGSESVASETPDSATNPKPDTVNVSSSENLRALDLATYGQEEQSHATKRLVQRQQAWPEAPFMDVDDLATRSKSCHWSMERCDEIKEDGSNMGIGKARSIHTVEEYDAILEKLWLSRSQQTIHNADDKSSTDEASQTSSGAVDDKGEGQEEKGSEKGIKRKGVAKGLGSLSLPQNIEFQNVGSLKDWLQVYSPVTPKFGSYDLPSSSTTESKSSASVAFNTELVAAFEECMQQLEAEEETVLKQIESNNDNQAEREGGMQN